MKKIEKEAKAVETEVSVEAKKAADAPVEVKKEKPKDRKSLNLRLEDLQTPQQQPKSQPC